MNNLAALIRELEERIPYHDTLNDKVSSSHVGWHIEHALLTINKIIADCKKSNPKDYKWRFKLPRILVFTWNKIPRGRAKSPQVVIPKEYDINTLKEHVQLTKMNLQDLPNISSDQYFNHPFFGDLKKAQTIQFLKIHTNHHLEIITDIITNRK